jgi:tetratricopeptide (TPR) repeat protein
VVEKALAKDKLDRFADGAEFAATLRTLSINTTPVSVETEKRTIQDSRAYNKRGLAHASTRNFEQAIIDFTKALDLDPQYAEAYNNRSTAHLMMGNYGQAVTDCTRALWLAPDFVATYVIGGLLIPVYANIKARLPTAKKRSSLTPIMFTLTSTWGTPTSG